MATFKPRKVAKPFHLPLEEYKKLFPEFKARGNKVIIVALSPITNLSISLNQSQQEKEKIVQVLSQRGHMIISVGDNTKNLKEGQLIFLPHLSLSSFAFNREIIIKDVFPRVRNYTMAIINEHDIEADILHSPDEIVEVEHEVNIDMEEKTYQEAIKAIEEKDQNINKF